MRKLFTLLTVGVAALSGSVAANGATASLKHASAGNSCFVPAKAEPVFHTSAAELTDRDKAAARMRRAASDTHTLTVSVAGDPKKYACVNVRIAGEDFRDGMWLDLDNPEYSTGTIDVPEGSYAVMAEFEIYNDSVMFGVGGWAWVVREVDVHSDASVTLDAATAVNEIKGKSYAPDGEEHMLPTDYYSTEATFLEGNVRYMQITTALYSDRFGTLYSRRLNGDFGVINENPDTRSFNLQDMANVHINTVGKGIAVWQCRMAATENDGYQYTVTPQLKGVHESAEFTYGTDYDVRYSPQFAKSRIGSDWVAGDGIYPYRAAGTVHMGASVTGGSVGGSNSQELAVCGQDNVPAWATPMFEIGAVDYGQDVYDEEDPGMLLGTMVYYTEPMPFMFLAQGTAATVYKPRAAQYDQTSENWYDLESGIFAPFGFDNDLCALRPGESQPVLSLMAYTEVDWETEERILYIDPLPLGRLGELRTADFPVMDVKFGELSGGRLGVTVTDANQTVDGLEGSTVLAAELDENALVIPTLRSLQFRNADGDVTDRFGTFAEGRLMLAAADYALATDPEELWNFWYDVAECEVRFSVSPRGTEEWTELPLEMSADEFDPSFGNVYRASLEYLALTSPDGWFDVKAELTSSTGAVSVQTVSPAFSVSQAMTGAAAVTSDTRERCYTLQGIEITRDILPAGIYIVKGADGSHRKVLKR